MNLDNLPRLLVITVNAWSDKIASGNTISNHLGNWDKSKLFNVFLRNEEIDNQCCENFFRVSEKDLLKSIFSKNDSGVEVKYKASSVKGPSFKPSKIKNFIFRIRPSFILLSREVFWKFGFLHKNKLDEFLMRNSPEVIYILCPSLIYGHRMLHYCHKVTNAKVVVFHGDGNYNYKSYWPLSYLYQLYLRYWIRKTINISSVNYAATPELSDYYSSVFGKEFKVLYKGVSILPPEMKSYTRKLNIVYAGNLLYGRWKTLALISQAISEISTDQDVFKLSIYTGTPLSKEMNTCLNTKYSTVFDAVPYSEVKKLMKDADIVLHVEAFDKKNIQSTKYSFSTKITDCIQSTNCIMAVGPNELASIKFLETSGGAIVANNYSEIVDELKMIALDHKIIDDKRFKMYDFSKDLFDLDIIRENIQKDFGSLCNRSK